MRACQRAEFGWPGGDCPGELLFRHWPERDVLAAVQQVLAGKLPGVEEGGTELAALCPPDGAVGRYRLDTPEGSWFVRISARWGLPELEADLTDYLFHSGLRVNPLIVAGVGLDWGNRRLRLDVRPLIRGRHFNGSAGDLVRLGETLKKAHERLARYPRSGEVRREAAMRSARLKDAVRLLEQALRSDGFDLFGDMAPWARDHRDWLAEMAALADPGPGNRGLEQCLHAQVHPGNVIFRAEDGEPVLLDFEESVRVHASPAWDVAHLVQRFCLRDDPEPREALSRLVPVVLGYGRLPDGLGDMMRQAAWHSMAVIIDLLVSEGVETPPSEYEKFERLERQGRRLAGIL